MALSRQGKVYSFRRTCLLSPWANIADVPTQQTVNNTINNSTTLGNYNFGYLKFKLNDLAGVTDFTNLYAKYKITGVRLKFIPIRNTESSVGNAGFMAPLAIAIQRGAIERTVDDRNFAAMLEQQDVRVVSSYKPFSIYIPYPKFYAPADGQVVAQEKSGWLQVRHPDVDHFGLQFAWAFNAANDIASHFQVFATYYVKCANPQ